MSVQAAVAICSLCVTLLVALVAATWRFASIATQLTAESKELREQIKKLADAIADIGKIPDILRRVGLLELANGDLAGKVHAHDTSLRLLDRDLRSIKPPRPGSIHDE